MGEGVGIHDPSDIPIKVTRSRVKKFRWPALETLFCSESDQSGTIVAKGKVIPVVH
jgi:hypothetical protein